MKLFAQSTDPSTESTAAHSSTENISGPGTIVHAPVSKSYRIVVNGIRFSIQKDLVYQDFLATALSTCGHEKSFEAAKTQGETIYVFYRDVKAGTDVQIDCDRTYATFKQAMDKKRILRTGGSVIFTVSIGEIPDDIHVPSSQIPHLDSQIPPSNQAVVMQLATRRVVRPSREAKEIADAEREMQFSQRKKKGLSQRCTLCKGFRFG